MYHHKAYFTIFTYLPYFAYLWRFPGQERLSGAAYSLPDRHFPIPSKGKEITSKGPRCGHAARAPGPAISAGPCGP